MEDPNDFQKRIVKFNDAFERLLACTKFAEADVAKGRKGAIAVRLDSEGRVPIVRTTTVYSCGPQTFSETLHALCEAISKAFFPLKFNNAMVELYDVTYRKMGFHTDQSQDLEAGSFICLFSCYEGNSSNASDFRKLVVQNKASKACFELQLDQCSAILFSTEANFRHVHKIILDSPKAKSRWIGVTLRLSKTFVKDGVLPDGTLLRVADAEERKTIFHLKSQENATDGEFVYPSVSFTISPSDLMNPI